MEKVEIYDGKYIVCLPEFPHEQPAHALRHGEMWIDNLYIYPGSNMILQMARELLESRAAVKGIMDAKQRLIKELTDGTPT